MFEMRRLTLKTPCFTLTFMRRRRHCLAALGGEAIPLCGTVPLSAARQFQLTLSCFTCETPCFTLAFRRFQLTFRRFQLELRRFQCAERRRRVNYRTSFCKTAFAVSKTNFAYRNHRLAQTCTDFSIRCPLYFILDEKGDVTLGNLR